MNYPVNFREVEIYCEESGKEPFTKWLLSLEETIQMKIRERLTRIELGNLGDYRRLNGGISEFRFHFGSGYRVYFGEINKRIILLLYGGDKSSQRKDVKKAKFYWKNYLESLNEKV